MREFFKFMAASALGQLVTGIILAFIFAVFLVSQLMNGFKDFDSHNQVEIKDNSVLHLRFDMPFQDQERNLDFPFDLMGGSSKGKGLNIILKSLERASKDDKIKGILLESATVGAGWASVEEIRNALEAFKKSGKFVVAYSEVYTHKGYYLATAADEILLYPEGLAQHTGLTAEILFLKGMLEKLELDMNIIRGSNNQFKSAVEPLLYDKMSDANRKQTEKYLGSIWNHTLTGISEKRGVTVEELNRLADELQLTTAQKSVDHKLIDRTAYRDELIANLKSRAGVKEEEELNLVKLSDYTRDKREAGKEREAQAARKDKKNKKDGKNYIAVIYAQGDIVDGKGDRESIGSETLAEQIREARLDSSVKAIVLRINSPGGSALASDVIWRETGLAGKAKPFIVSMGDLAASGGYYIACNAHRIYAQPNTITGSIGVFGVLPNTARMFKNKLGITFDRVRTNAHSDLGSVSRPLDDFEYKVIQEGVDEIYHDFISKVGEGRNLSTEVVDSIGQGRVWSGVDALEIGLVDELGGLNDAIREAAKRAKIENYELVEYPEVKNPIQEFFEELQYETKAELMRTHFGLQAEMATYLNQLSKLLQQKGVQARIPYLITIE